MHKKYNAFWRTISNLLSWQAVGTVRLNVKKILFGKRVLSKNFMDIHRGKFKRCSYNLRLFTGLLGSLPDCPVDLLAERLDPQDLVRWIRDALNWDPFIRGDTVVWIKCSSNVKVSARVFWVTWWWPKAGWKHAVIFTVYIQLDVWVECRRVCHLTYKFLRAQPHFSRCYFFNAQIMINP